LACPDHLDKLDAGKHLPFDKLRAGFSTSSSQARVEGVEDINSLGDVCRGY
jgi:hypothetical protein